MMVFISSHIGLHNLTRLYSTRQKKYHLKKKKPITFILLSSPLPYHSYCGDRGKLVAWAPSRVLARSIMALCGLITAVITSVLFSVEAVVRRVDALVQ